MNATAWWPTRRAVALKQVLYESRPIVLFDPPFARRAQRRRHPVRSPGLLVSRAETDIGDRYAFPACLDRHAARRTAPKRGTLHWPAGPAHVPESARGRTYHGRRDDTGDNETDRNGGQGKDAVGHTNASACFLAARDAAPLTPAFTTHRPCRAINPTHARRLKRLEGAARGQPAAGGRCAGRPRRAVGGAFSSRRRVPIVLDPGRSAARRRAVAGCGPTRFPSSPRWTNVPLDVRSGRWFFVRVPRCSCGARSCR